MNLLHRPSKVVAARADVRKRLTQEFRTISFVGPKGGRPKDTLIGAERRQLDVGLGVRVFGLLLEEYAAKGIVIDPLMAMDLTPQGRRNYIANLLNAMSRPHLRITTDLPKKSLYDTLGDLIRTRKTNHEKRGGEGIYAYVNKDCATSLELRQGFNTHRMQAQGRRDRDDSLNEVWALGLADFPAGKTLMEAYAEEAQDFLARQ